ncbi:hypothetical protein F3K40_31705 [Streptomyces sp. LBUM 1478]|nr:hypothetical protein [Streptomyces sp. LBUM 1478]
MHEVVRLRQPLDEHPGVVDAVQGMPDDDADAAGDRAELVLEVFAGLGEERVAADGGPDALAGPVATVLGLRPPSDQVRQEECEAPLVARAAVKTMRRMAGRAWPGACSSTWFPSRPQWREEERQGEEAAGQRVSL